jgi:hypothetical protein
MRLTKSYRGYIVEADPVRRGRRWAARVVFETREHGAAHFQEVPDDDPRHAPRPRTVVDGWKHYSLTP